MKQRLGSDPLSWIRDTRAPQEDTNTGEQSARPAVTRPDAAAPAASTNDTNTDERDAAAAAPDAAAPAASLNDTNTGERDAAARPAAAPAASTNDTNTGEQSTRPAAAPAASTNDANTGEQSDRPAARPARRKPASTKKTNTGERAAAPAAQAAPASDANTGELPGEEALRALIARELAGLTPRRGRPRTNLREVTSSSQEGLPENWTRATFIVRQTLLEDLKDCAYTQRRTIRDVLDEALRAYLSGQELLRRPR